MWRTVQSGFDFLNFVGKERLLILWNLNLKAFLSILFPFSCLIKALTLVCLFVSSLFGDVPNRVCWEWADLQYNHISAHLKGLIKPLPKTDAGYSLCSVQLTSLSLHCLCVCYSATTWCSYDTFPIPHMAFFYSSVWTVARVWLMPMSGDHGKKIFQGNTSIIKEEL